MNNLWIDVPLLSWYREEDPSRSTLLNGDFEGGIGPPPASWTEANVVGTREAGHRTGGAGSYVGQVAYDGSHATGELYQSGLVIGAPYRLDGWARGDGAANPKYSDSGGAGVWTGTSSALWQQFTTGQFIAAGGYHYLFGQSLAAGRLVQWDDLVLTPFVARTRNRGLLGGGLQLGDGLAAATFPTFVGGGKRGIALNGSQYLQWLAAIPNGTYTWYALLTRTSAGTNSAFLLDTRAGGGTGYIWWNGTALESSSGTLYVNGVASTALPYGELAFISCVGIVLDAPSKIVLQASNILGTAWVGNVYCQALYPYALTPTQLRALHERAMMEVNLP